MDAFFASIEIARNQSLRGKPVIVGGRPDQRGVVSTCSYEARTFGVHSAMPLSEAKRLCPNGVFIEGNFTLYREYSDLVIAILYSHTPLVEVVSIDEAYLDVTDVLEPGMTAKALGQQIRQEVYHKTALTCSIGIASNKLVAKIASSLAKPNGLKEVEAGKEVTFLAPLPIQSLPGIGPKTQIALNRRNIKTVADLQAIPLDMLIQQYGARGYSFFLISRGEDNRPVEPEERPPKSIGAETTFAIDHSDLPFLEAELTELVERVYQRLRNHKMRTRRISLKLRDSHFKTITRSHTLVTHVNSHERILEETLALFAASYPGNPPLRLVGVSLELLTDSYWQQTFWEM
jgi:DNA polymerase IV